MSNPLYGREAHQTTLDGRHRWHPIGVMGHSNDREYVMRVSGGYLR